MGRECHPLIASSVLLKVEIKSWAMLELQAPFSSVTPPPHDHERGEKTERLKLFSKLSGVPHLAVLLFQRRSASRFQIDLCDTLAAIGFGAVGHGGFFLVELSSHHCDFLYNQTCNSA